MNCRILHDLKRPAAKFFPRKRDNWFFWLTGLFLQSLISSRVYYGRTGTVHVMPEPRFSLRTNLSRKGSFSKTVLRPENFETQGFCFLVNEKRFENGAFHYYDITLNTWFLSLTEIFSNTNPKWPSIVTFSNSFAVEWTRPRPVRVLVIHNKGILKTSFQTIRLHVMISNCNKKQTRVLRKNKVVWWIRQLAD